MKTFYMHKQYDYYRLDYILYFFDMRCIIIYMMCIHTDPRLMFLYCKMDRWQKDNR